MTTEPACSTSAVRRNLLPAMPAADAAMSSNGSTHPRDGVDVARAAHPVNPVILALVVALRDVEQRRGRGKVLTQVTFKRRAA